MHLCDKNDEWTYTSSPTMLQNFTRVLLLTKCAASATLWPTPPIDCDMDAGFEV
jgi:hypothetical protein